MIKFSLQSVRKTKHAFPYFKGLAGSKCAPSQFGKSHISQQNIEDTAVDSSHQEVAVWQVCVRGIIWPVVLRLWSRSCEGRKPVGLGGWDGERGAEELLGAGWDAVEVVAAGGSKQPKASCHALLKSSAPPEAPGLSRSCRNDRSPLSPSSSSAPDCGVRPESRSLPTRAKQFWHSKLNQKCLPTLRHRS